jgi:hypothetical protein
MRIFPHLFRRGTAGLIVIVLFLKVVSCVREAASAGGQPTWSGAGWPHPLGRASGHSSSPRIRAKSRVISAAIPAGALPPTPPPSTRTTMVYSARPSGP